MFRNSRVKRLRRRPRRVPMPGFRRLAIELLEDRAVLNGGTLGAAVDLSFTPANTAHVAGFLSTANAVDLYRVQLHVGDEIHAAITAQASGSGLQSVLRVFDAAGSQVAMVDQEGGDPQMVFQASTTGDYYLGVSSAGDDAYDPNKAGSGHGGATTGLYTLDLRRDAQTPLLADLAGSSFRLGTPTAAWGETVPVNFTVENRGGAAAGEFRVQVLLSTNQPFGDSSEILETQSVPGLAAAQAYSSGTSVVNLPDLATAKGDGLTASGPVYIGLRIDPAHSVTELNAFDQSGVHRGADWETLTIVTRVVADGQNHTAATAQALTDLDSQVTGTLTAGESDSYQMTVAQGQPGELSLNVAPSTGNSEELRLTLADQAGANVLIQSDSGSISQYLTAGTYQVGVAALSGSGSYQLTTRFVFVDDPESPLPAGEGPASVAVADLGNGHPDIIVANEGGGVGVLSEEGTVSVLLGNGDGTFQPQQTYDVGDHPDSVAVADLGNGHPDIIVANYEDDTVSVLLGNGDGTFQPQQTYDVGEQPYSVVVADLGNGHPDIIVANSEGNTIGVLLGNGDGTFQPQQTYAVGDSPRSVAVADLGNGHPDIIVANSYDNTVGVLLGNGDGTFQPQKTYHVGDNPESVAVADLGNGHPDIIVANGTVLLGNGDGTFQPQQKYAVGDYPSSVAVADLGNGHEDVLVANTMGDTVSVLLGNGDGAFQPRQTYNVGDLPDSVAVADLGNGHADIVVADGIDTVDLLMGNGDGTFRVQPTYGVGDQPASVAVADLGNGHPDIIVANSADDNVGVLLGNGAGGFQPQETYAVGDLPDSVVVGDVNDDGRPDVIVANDNGTVGVLLGNGDGTFQAQQTYDVGRNPTSVAVADLGNGYPDIIVANSTEDNVGVLLGNGDGTFQPEQTYAVGGEPYSVAVADLGNGHPDIIVANYEDGTVSVLLGNSDGTFQPQKTYHVGDQPVSLVPQITIGGPWRACFTQLPAFSFFLDGASCPVSIAQKSLPPV